MKKITFYLLATALFIIFLGGTYYRATAPPPPVVVEDHIIINKSRNELYFYRDHKLYKKYCVATGKTDDLTPEGWHNIVTKFKDPMGGDKNKDNPFGPRWMGLKVPEHKNGLKYGIHGTNEPESIGKYASGGCIRMNNDEVKEIYEKVEINTPVIIYKEIFAKK